MMDLLLKLSSDKDALTLSSIKVPDVAVADHNHITVCGHVALFGMRYTPVETLIHRTEYVNVMGLKTNRYVPIQNGEFLNWELNADKQTLMSKASSIPSCFPYKLSKCNSPNRYIPVFNYSPSSVLLRPSFGKG